MGEKRNFLESKWVSTGLFLYWRSLKLCSLYRGLMVWFCIRRSRLLLEVGSSDTLNRRPQINLPCKLFLVLMPAVSGISSSEFLKKRIIRSKLRRIHTECDSILLKDIKDHRSLVCNLASGENNWSLIEKGSGLNSTWPAPSWLESAVGRARIPLKLEFFSVFIFATA